MTFEDIKKANDSIQTMDVKDKEYAPVNQRIKAFRMVFPQGFILTEMTGNQNGVCIFRAQVGYEDEKGHHVLGTGTAYEKESSSFINKTSYIENCETSAVGRALGMAGFGIDTSVASAEEVQNAIKNQEQPKEEKAAPKATGEQAKPIQKATEEQVRLLKELFNEERQSKLLSFYKVEKLDDIPMQAASRLIEKAREKQ